MTPKKRRKIATVRNRNFKHLVIKSILEGKEVPCGICGKTLTIDDISIDHIVPQSKGGALTWDNLQPTHKVCNQAKGDTYATDPESE